MKRGILAKIHKFAYKEQGKQSTNLKKVSHKFSLHWKEVKFGNKVEPLVNKQVKMKLEFKVLRVFQEKNSSFLECKNTD